MRRCVECSCENSFNEHGYCMECGAKENSEEPSTVEPFHVQWPRNTWFQNRRKLVALKAARGE